jgi:hypothetical protein
METQQESEGAEVDPFTRPRLGADELRASLEAVRSAQSAARARARTETRWARAIVAGALMAVGVTAWAAARHPRRASVAARAEAIATHLAPSISPPPVEAPSADPPAPTAPVARSSAADSGDAVAFCDGAFAQRNWPAIASTCAVAFEARPREGALAMRVAQAEHRRGHVALAADWARKALAIDASAPEAYVIVAHAERAAGREDAAAEAYRRYLTLAPRGWHAAEARRALRAER